MPLTKHYLRYTHSATLGVVSGRSANLLLLDGGRQVGAGQRRVLVAAPAVEDVVVWDPRRAEKVACLPGSVGQEVSRLCASRDGTRLAVGCIDGTVRLWNILTRETTVTFSGHKSAITCLEFDHSGTLLISGSKDTDVIVWDVVSECGLYRLRGHKAPVTACRLLHHTNILITSSKDCLIKLWDLDTQHCFQTIASHTAEVWDVEVVAMETRLVSASSGKELQVFNLTKDVIAREEEEGEEEGRLRKRRTVEDEEISNKPPVSCLSHGSLQRGSTDRVLQLKADCSGRVLGCLAAGSLELFLVRSEEERASALKRRKKKARKKAKPEGDEPEEELALTAADELPLVCTIPSKAKIRSFAFLSQSQFKLCVALGLHKNSVELYTLDLQTTPTTHTYVSSIETPAHRTDIRTLCFSSDDALFASGSAKMVKVWNRSNLQCLHTMASGYALCSTFVPGDRHLLVGTKTGQLQLFSVESGDLLETVSAHLSAVWSVAIAPDRRGLVTGSADHDVKFWEFELISDENSSKRRLSMCHMKTLKMAEDVLSVCYSPDQRLLAVALLDSTVKVFFSDTLKFFLSLYGHKLPVLSMDISSDSTLLATCSADKNIRLWGLDYGDCHKSLFAHDESVMNVKFVPGSHLLFSCSKDHHLKCWDGDTFEHITTLEGHCGEVWCLAISHNGDTVLTGSHDQSLRVWEKTEEPLILSEEKEREREAKFEEAVAEGGEPAVPGEEGEGEVVMAGKKTVESMKATERLLEALALYREEKGKREEWEEEMRAVAHQLPLPKPHPILVAMGDLTPEKYVLLVVQKIRSSDLEEALLVMPFSEVALFLSLLQLWIKGGLELELSCRCLLFLLRIHHSQIVTNHMLLPVLDSLRQYTRPQVENLRDLYGFNLAGLRCLQTEQEKTGSPVFADLSELLKKVQKKRKVVLAHRT